MISSGVTTIPTGTVTLSDATAVLTTINLARGVADFPVSLATGAHQLRATYNGDAAFRSATSATLPETIRTSAVHLSAPPVSKATAVFSATMTRTPSGGAVAGETVTFSTTSLFGGTELCARR